MEKIFRMHLDNNNSLGGLHIGQMKKEQYDQFKWDKINIFHFNGRPFFFSDNEEILKSFACGWNESNNFKENGYNKWNELSGKISPLKETEDI